MRRRWIVVALLAGLVVAGCSGADPAAQSSVTATPSESNPYGVLDIDPPADDEPILTVRDGAQVRTFTFPQLRALESVEATLFEPFVKKTQTFVGVRLATVLEAAGLPSRAQVETIALNDYRWTGSVADIVGSQGLIAYRVDGRSIGYDEGGPIRLVFPDGTPMATVLEAWNWSLSELSLR